ncbi:MAG: acylglycerol kinase family protein [Actinobacteria bacterium]|nr:acylglycerol kinase family protein [Actinomycetota bacterium]
MERFTQESVKRPMKEEEAEGRRQKYLVVINPVSRGGKAIKEGLWLLKQMGRLGINHETFITENPGHAEDIVKRWVEQVDVVVAVGGDGTVNEILNGMMSSKGCEKTLAVFPAGTADEYCHNVGVPRDRNRALDILLTDNSRRIDLIKWNDRYAIVQVGVGRRGSRVQRPALQDGEVYKYAAGEKLELSMVRDGLKVSVPRKPPDPPPFVKC